MYLKTYSTYNVGYKVNCNGQTSYVDNYFYCRIRLVELLYDVY